jgi:hypothetical protein
MLGRRLIMAAWQGWISKRIPAVVVGMSVMEWGYFMYHPNDWMLWGVLGWGVAGLLIAHGIEEAFRGICAAVHGPTAIRVGLWASWGALIGGIMGVAAKHCAGESSGVLAWLLCGTYFDVWLRCLVFGGMLVLLQLGWYFDFHSAHADK